MSNQIFAEKPVKDVTKLYKELSEVVSKNVKVFSDLKEAAKIPSDYIKKLNNINEAQEKLNTSIKKTSDAVGKKAAQDKKEQASLKQDVLLRNKRIKAIDNFNKKEEAALRKRESQVKKESDLRDRLLAQRKKEELAYEKATQLNKKLGRAYNILVQKMDAAARKVQDLTAKKSQGIKLSKREQLELKASARSFAKYNKAVTNSDAAVKRFQRNVGNYPKGLRAAASAARSLASAMGAMGGAFLVAGTIRNAVGIFTRFNQSQADLAAILGRSTSEITDLTEQSRELGATTAFTATQVAELQLELAKLGFKDDQILKATLGIENLAIATGVEAARAAKLGGAALRGFSRDASEANDVAATLAVSTTKSALTFEALETALPKVSAIAKSFGFTLEDTTALLGGLQNAGFEASVSGTSLRQIFLQLADSNGKLAKRLGGGAKNFDELIEQFKKVEKEGISLGEAFNLTNARSVAAFKVFLEGADDMHALRDSITDVENELDTLADQKLDSVTGRVTLLNSAWEGWVLALDESGEAATTVKSSLEFLTKNLDRILNTIVRVGKAFLIYKAIIIATSLVTRLYTSSVVALRIAKIALSGGITKATRAMRLFNITTKASPIGLLLGALTIAVSLFAAFRDGAAEAAEAQRQLNERLEENERITDKKIKKNIAAIDEQLKAIDDTIDVEKKANKDKISLLDDEINKRKENIESYNKQAKEGKKSIGELMAIEKGLIKSRKKPTKLDFLNIKKATDDVVISDKEIEILKKKRKELIVLLGKTTRSGNAENAKKARLATQKLAEFEIQDQIKRLNNLISNEDNINAQRVQATKERTVLEMDLEKIKTKFAIDSGKLKGDALVLAEKELQSKLIDIAIKSNNEIKKINSRDESEEEEGDIGIDTKQHLLDELVEAGAGTYAELRDLYDEDREAFLKLAQDKLAIAEEFTQAQKEAMQTVFDTFGDVYGVDTEKFLKLFDGKKNTVEDYAAAAGEAAKGLYELFAKNYDSDIEANRLALETSLQYVEEGSAAEEKLRADAEKEENRIKKKQAKADRDQGVFNILINTAMGVSSAIAASPLTLGLPWSAVIAGLGLASAAKVASTPLPAFKGGVIGFEGGEALVNDQKGSSYREYIQTPDGNMFKPEGRNVVMDLPKGTNVFSAKESASFDKELDNILADNKMLPYNSSVPSSDTVVNVNGGVSAKEMDSIMRKHFSKITKNVTNIDKNGFNTYVTSGYSKTVEHEARVNFEGFSV